uniref:Peptidase M14 domain-containing protein n=1 Tax=Anopheles christyi TaxID=43041 RepID=A0A182KDH9_9DIPT
MGLAACKHEIKNKEILTPSKAEQVRVVRETFDDYGFAKTPKFVHHNYTAMVSYIQELASNYPTITHLYTIGKSVQGRDLWVMEVTETPGQHIPGKPEVKYIANMHGNEVVGRELLLLFAKYLCENYNRTERITKLLNRTRLHLLYSMNPDGYELADINDKESLRGRSNANNVDLNRNFPDQFGRNQYNAHQEPETVAVMNWSLATPFVLSANLHGGALVANYPYDDSPKDFAYSSGYGDPRTVKNPTEENELFQYLAHVYANSHTTMHLGRPCPSFLRENFPDGITNGAAWYSVTGGMQDWSYVTGGAYELTLEVGCDKFPPASQLPDFWKQNREALLQYVEQAQHGITGYVRSTIGHPIGRASVQVNQIEHVTYTTANGDFYRLLLPGLYNVTAEAEGYEPQTLQVRIPPEADRAVIVDFQLMRDDPQHWSSAYDYRTLENVIKTRYHSDAELKATMAEFENKHYKSVEVEFGNEVSMAYPSVKVTDNIGTPEETKLHILIISSLFQTAAIGREMTMNLVRHVLAGYLIKEPLLIKLLQNAVLHFVPVKNDFEEIMDQFRANASVCNPTLHSDELADKLLNAETDHQKDMFLRMLKDDEYDLALTFAAGGHDVFFPNTDDKVAIYSRFAEKIKGHKYRQSGGSDGKCTVDAGQLHQVEATQRVTNAIHKLYEVPLFTMQLGCCKMPSEPSIASVWRQNLERMINFLRLIDTGIRGYVKDVHGAALRKAILRVRGNNLIYKVTPNLAHFRIVLPSGSMEIEISCYNYTSRIMPITLGDNQILDLGDIVMQEAARPRESIVEPPVPVEPQALPQQHHDFAVLEPSKTMKVFPQDGGVEVNAAVSGIVLDDGNHPLPNAKVYVSDAHSQQVLANGRTGPLGKFQFESLSSAKDIVVHAEPYGYEPGAKTIRQGPLGGASGIVFHLTRDERVLGLPRLVFVLLAGCISVGIIVGGIMCFMYIQARRRDARYYYNFSLLPQKGEPNRKLFDDDEETELFRASTTKLQPYYDDERDPITDTDDDSEEEIVMLNPSFRNSISQS